MSTRDLDRLFNPRSVAVVGASFKSRGHWRAPIAFLQAQGFGGRIFPVNPKYDEIAGLTCYPELSMLPEAPDIVVIAVAAPMVPAMLSAAGARGAGFAIVFSAGFAEAGEDGAERQALLAKVARDAGVVLIGPNCQGMMNMSTPSMWVLVHPTG